MPIPFNETTKELAKMSIDELLAIDRGLDKILEEIKRKPFEDFEKKVKGEYKKEEIPDEDISADAVRVEDNKLMLINEETGKIIHTYVCKSNEEAIRDFQTLVELLELEVIEENKYAR